MDIPGDVRSLDSNHDLPSAAQVRHEYSPPATASLTPDSGVFVNFLLLAFSIPSAPPGIQYQNDGLLRHELKDVTLGRTELHARGGPAGKPLPGWFQPVRWYSSRLCVAGRFSAEAWVRCRLAGVGERGVHSWARRSLSLHVGRFRRQALNSA